MARLRQQQTNFSAGELAPEFGMRKDTQQYADGAKALRNARLLVAGGFRRRPGGKWRADLEGNSRVVEFVVNQSTKYLAAFGQSRVDFYLPDGTAAGSLTGCAWSGTIWSEMGYVQSGQVMFLTHQDMAVQVITRTGASTWAVIDYAFFVSEGGRINQPYYKLAPRAVTMATSALTGSINVTLSDEWWQPAHVGQRIRYLGREIEITSYADGFTVIGTVIEELPPTLQLTVPSSSGFATGQVVEGDTTGAKGIVTAVAVGFVTVVLKDKLTHFDTSDKLVGPRSATTISAVGVTTIAAVEDWDEALFNTLNGFPACIEIHRNRLLLGGHRSLPGALLASRIDNFYDFDVGTGADADAIFEFVGDGAAAEIRHIVSAEQLLVLTDVGPYYVPESNANPFRATSIAFSRFGGEWPAAAARPVAFDGGVVMVSGSLAIKLKPTGDLSRQWSADELSLIADHLLDAPVDTAATTNFGGGPERYTVFVNADGTLAVMMLVEAQQIRSFVPWDTNGEYLSIAALSGTLYAVVRRTIAGATRYILEEFDQGFTLDAATEYDDLDDAAARYDGTDDVHVVASTFHLGLLEDQTDPPDGPYQVGLDYTLRVETLPPVLEGVPGGGAGRLKRITRVEVETLESARFVVNGTALTAYQIGEALDAPPPLREGPRSFRLRGWKRDPTIVITQADPLPLTVLGLTMEVAF